ncbi:Hypothetical protein D9617_6g094620 [Elsinoe fawcettii]|nr:Hypothetical protein D9617_6g094620 [Elsinoe fawcettii]
MNSCTAILLLCNAFLPVTLAFKIDLYQGSKCTGIRTAQFIMGPDQGCKTDPTAMASAAVITSTGPVDDLFTAVFYSSPDCTPGTAINHTDEGCIAVNYQSFNVRSVCEGGTEDCLFPLAATNDVATGLGGLITGMLGGFEGDDGAERYEYGSMQDGEFVMDFDEQSGD